MINYIRHDNEFFGVVKLVTGEEVIGTMIDLRPHYITACDIVISRYRDIVIVLSFGW